MNSSIINSLTDSRYIRIPYYLFFLVSFSLSSCSDLPKEIYRGYTGRDVVEEKLAILEIGESHKIKMVMVDSNIFVDTAEYSAIKLQPGLHQIQIAATFGGSIMMFPGGIIHRISPAFRAPLEAGRTYICRAARSFGLEIDFFFWIEDAKTGELIAGRKIPSWKSW